ncbi:S-layer domain-containing protein [Ruminiclostridium papyrosolvens DSM 2782]|uniref:S-layer domain-containing protein n=1 Tax=Ruminiclostridium papyrosolvens DSM 2782 TaxID=588581 RepID=F1TH15_9FIRM|nr:S-layer homology domain-containing protein [Ruminiclostridium papyrosolvens]EGD46255.1 S-layer domain-containing protein [Ruminiclostridium papyrosolvens DSM 2782]WES33023.1 S-layer homology domain-containing protein [Ruminiclostridium papyrosolvens DSM 2782]
MIKKLLCMITVLTIILSALLPITAENADPSDSTTTAMRMKPLLDKYNGLTQASLDTELAKYSDIKSHWGRNFISKISALEIISGYPDGSFRPDEKLLGGQYILMLVRAIGYRPEVPQGVPYYKPFVDIALKEGILSKGEISDYAKPITRELAASLARRTIGKYETVPKDYFVKGSDPYPSKGNKGLFDNVYAGYQKIKMTDYPTITGNYLQDVIDCYRVGLLTGSNNKFNPKGTLTRAEASVIIIKLLDKKARVESVPSADESFKWTNSNANNGTYDNESAGFYENKEYTLYKGLFPMMEIWETAQTMYKNRNLITGGKIDFTFSEKYESFGVNYFNGEDHFKKYMNYNDGTILPLNGMGIATQRSQIKKGQKESLYDNCEGYLYEISSYEVGKYNKDLKNYIYELLKFWFGKDYEQAKKIHDQYLSIAVKDADWREGVYLLNNRQIYIGGGNGTTGINGDAFKLQVWAKGFITKDMMLKLN